MSVSGCLNHLPVGYLHRFNANETLLIDGKNASITNDMGSITGTYVVDEATGFQYAAATFNNSCGAVVFSVTGKTTDTLAVKATKNTGNDSSYRVKSCGPDKYPNSMEEGWGNMSISYAGLTALPVYDGAGVIIVEQGLECAGVARVEFNTSLLTQYCAWAKQVRSVCEDNHIPKPTEASSAPQQDKRRSRLALVVTVVSAGLSLLAHTV